MEIIKTPLNYGSMAGIASFAVFLLLYILGYNPLGGISWLGAWVPIVFIALGIKKQRDQDFDGFISYGKAFGTGSLITLVYASFFAILVYLFGFFIDGSIVDQVINDAMEGMEKASQFLGEEMYDQLIEQLEQTTIASVAMGEFWNKILGGLIVSLIVAAILKRKRHPFEEIADE